MKNVMKRVGLLAALLLSVSCSIPENEAPEASGGVVARWDHLPRGETWTRAALEALDGPGQTLALTTPSDIDVWCPGYETASIDGRKAFWVGLVSALAKHESTWRPEVSGGEGRWHGLLQISPGTARGYGCAATDASALKNGAANLRCGLRIMAVTVPRDGVVSRGGRGVAADWGPFHQANKREDMIAWTRQLPSCRT
ncbi:transglycosylase SLT domain-containing protein [Ovoidimarina sediminis]|uniref:transglycosylase SLT domain-containing protein n=1 Tax=Ovoidimarina sediminis TaxID=3079856 RepID=UPI0029099927|nr:transglycosylase SLT domain-containing protein [Rhodophyticola sp. MJ-SS7]MDU8944895.1 transglycosylase SLT domain-containing protein [Rhodophyticola sp. MJ-SS7]